MSDINMHVANILRGFSRNKESRRQSVSLVLSYLPDGGVGRELVVNDVFDQLSQSTHESPIKLADIICSAEIASYSEPEEVIDLVEEEKEEPAEEEKSERKSGRRTKKSRNKK